MGSICIQEMKMISSLQEEQQQTQQKVQQNFDASHEDWLSDDTDLTVSKQYQIGIINPSLTYQYQELTKNANQIENFLKSLGSKRILKTSQNLNDQLLETILKSPHTNQFVQMVHIAYYGHFPLRFSPDNIQLLINQVFAQHIKYNAEKFREKFVSHEGKKNLVVRVDHLDVDRYDWPNIVKQFSKQIKQNIGKERYQLYVHKYSTTDFTARTCYEMSLMDAMQKYFTYIMHYGCGISKIKLLGTLEDWIKLKENAQKLREFELDHWINQLDPILDQFIRLYQGDIDKEFWGNIYRYQPKGGIYSNQKEYATGWITSFFPNSDLDNSLFFSDPRQQNKEKNPYCKVAPDQLPTGITQAPVQLIHLMTGLKLMDLEFCAGFFGVGLDEDGFLYPYQGWAIKEKVKEKKNDDLVYW